MKIVKSVSLMMLGMGVYMVYDKYGRDIMNKMSKKMDKSIKKVSYKIEEIL